MKKAFQNKTRKLISPVDVWSTLWEEHMIRFHQYRPTKKSVMALKTESTQPLINGATSHQVLFNCTSLSSLWCRKTFRIIDKGLKAGNFFTASYGTKWKRSLPVVQNNKLRQIHVEHLPHSSFKQSACCLHYSVVSCPVEQVPWWSLPLAAHHPHQSWNGKGRLY